MMKTLTKDESRDFGEKWKGEGEARASWQISIVCKMCCPKKNLIARENRDITLFIFWPLWCKIGTANASTCSRLLPFLFSGSDFTPKGNFLFSCFVLAAGFCFASHALELQWCPKNMYFVLVFILLLFFYLNFLTGNNSFCIIVTLFPSLCSFFYIFFCVFLRLLSSIKPGLVKKINRLPTPIAGLVRFVTSCFTPLS